MLQELRISNFAIIEQSSVLFAPGLNVITGETGAGKSIVLQALELLLGARPKAHFVRAGAAELEVEAVFDLSSLPAEVMELLPDIARGEELLISRKVASDGRGKVYVNGRLGTVSLLQEIVGHVVNICGQGQHVRLLDPRFHLEIVDRFAGHDAVKQRYRLAYDTWHESHKALEALEASLAKGEARRGELETIVNDLRALEPRSGMRAELEEEVKRHGNAEHILKAIADMEALLEDESGIAGSLQSLGAAVQELLKLDPGFSQPAQLFHSARAELQELGTELSRYGASVDLDEEKLSLLRDKLADVARLERKYKTNDAGLVSLLASAEAELKAFQNVEDIEKIRRDVEQKFQLVMKFGSELTHARELAARRLAKTAQKELAEVSMAQSELGSRFEASPPGPEGLDRVELLISPNKGEPLKPLREIASGGELSRLMLVLKKIVRDVTGVNVLVFDEVDTGISGAVARAVGEKLKSLSASSQVICITHLPQVASLADRHLLVEKTSDKRTHSQVRIIENDERVEEIARMIAGHKVTKAARESARELISSAA